MPAPRYETPLRNVRQKLIVRRRKARDPGRTCKVCAAPLQQTGWGLAAASRECGEFSGRWRDGSGAVLSEIWLSSGCLLGRVCMFVFGVSCV